MTADNFCFYLQNRVFQTKQEVNGTVILPLLVFPGSTISGSTIQSTNQTPLNHKLACLHICKKAANTTKTHQLIPELSNFIDFSKNQAPSLKRLEKDERDP